MVTLSSPSPQHGHTRVAVAIAVGVLVVHTSIRHGIILSGIGKYQSTKEYIANTYTMRDHWLQAVEINSNDASAYHLLGRWSFDVAEMSWVKRKLAATLFAEPPQVQSPSMVLCVYPGRSACVSVCQSIHGCTCLRARS